MKQESRALFHYCWILASTPEKSYKPLTTYVIQRITNFYLEVPIHYSGELPRYIF